MAKPGDTVRSRLDDALQVPKVDPQLFVLPPNARGTFVPPIDWSQTGRQAGDLSWNQTVVEQGSERVQVISWRRKAVAPLTDLQVGTRPFSSTNYQASLRRRLCLGLARELGDLELRVAQDDLAVYTYPITDGLRKLLTELADSLTEGNTCEIIRRLRDTFLDGGWNQYRQQKARQAGVDILDFLGQAEKVSTEDADRFFDLLYESGLKPLSMPLLTFTLEDDEEDEEGEVPD